MNKASFCAILISTLLAGLLLVDGNCYVVEASSEGAGLTQVVNSDTIWKKADSPYTITGPLFVSEGATLTIEAGVSVYLNGYDVLVNGELRVLGSSSEKIFLMGSGNTIEFSELSIGWDEQTSFGNIFENVVLDGVNIVSVVSIKICDSSINLRVDVDKSSIIEGSTIGALQIDGGSVVVRNCTIDLIRNCYGTAEITHNTIDEFCPNGYGFSPVISDNKIRTIGGYKIEGTTFTTMHATLYSTIITNNFITEGIYLVSGPSTVIQNNTIIGVPHKYTYYVYYPVPGSRGEPREGTYYTAGIDIAGRGAEINDKIYCALHSDE